MSLRAFFWEQFTEWRLRCEPQQAQQAILLALFIRFGSSDQQRTELQDLLQAFYQQPNSSAFRQKWKSWGQQQGWTERLQDWPLQEEVDAQAKLLQAALDLPEMPDPGLAFSQLLRESRWELQRQRAPLPALLAQLLVDSLSPQAGDRILELNFGQQLGLLVPRLPKQAQLYASLNTACTETRLAQIALSLLDRPLQAKKNSDKGFDKALAVFQQAGSALDKQLRALLEQLNEDGQLAALVPQAFLQEQNHSLREWLLRKDWLETIVQLPPDVLPRQKKPFVLLLLNKRKVQSRWLRVLFVDVQSALPLGEQQRPKQWSAEQYERLLEALRQPTLDQQHPLYPYCAWVKPERIAAEQFALEPARYAAPILHSLQQSEQPLCEFSRYFTDQAPRIWLEQQQDYPFVQSSNLSHGFADARLNYAQLQKPKTPCKGQLLRRAALLLCGPADDLRLAYFDGQAPVVVAEDILLLYPKASVEVDYLLLCFFDASFLAQLKWRDQLQEGRIQSSDIYQLRVPDWNANQRRQWVQEQKRRLLKAEEHKVAQLRQTLDLDKQRAAEQQLRIVASLQHELGNKLPAALNELHSLRDYLQTQIDRKQVPSWEQPLFPDWPEAEQDNNLQALLQRLEHNLHYALDCLSASSHLLRTDRQRLQKQGLNFQQLLENWAANYAQHPQFDLELEMEQTEKGSIDTWVEADAQQWHIALENLVENALRHGFSTQRRHRIRFSLEQSVDGRYLQLRYQNDGKPFPADFGLEDFIRYGQYAGEKGRTGIGGFLVHRIVENHGGSLHWHCKQPPQWPFPVDLELRFPKEASNGF